MRELKFRSFLFGKWDYWGFVGDKWIPAPVGLGDVETFKKLTSQYTGRDDKNGREIWEGDVVTCDEPLGMKRLFKQVVGEVVYLENVASFGVEILGDPASLRAGRVKEEEGGIFAYSWHMGHLRNFSVIGNVHENPELLK